MYACECRNDGDDLDPAPRLLTSRTPLAIVGSAHCCCCCWWCTTTIRTTHTQRAIVGIICRCLCRCAVPMIVCATSLVATVIKTSNPWHFFFDFFCSLYFSCIVYSLPGSTTERQTSSAHAQVSVRSSSIRANWNFCEDIGNFHPIHTYARILHE